ncbi:hypothetical protein K491DRAFT_610185 [Lophiostoma macrostomum CBS 122681]|uniref:Zn(2)-C6 fungal-type domain-containing protein n=1 Tax=Lophiostoma macrostomum CBS 122681 TaxID=1314788 RepID=A0A6A6SRZ6_9PLEO|nr:hypothetical protein K491DRAFT_610185 [Lophiostoma macrostomum CBS 122681]
MLSKTCNNCFQLKIRCDRTQRTDVCDRCARLGKQCVFRPARRRDNSAKRDSRIHALEQQVQDLLKTQQPSPIAQQPLPERAPSIASMHLSAVPEVPPTTGDVIDEDVLSIEKADTLVELYKSELMPHFPFIIIPADVTGSSLRNQKPFLFLAVITVTSFHDLVLQEKLGERFKYQVTDKVLFGGDDCLSLEYLQGLLVVLSWNQYHGKTKFFTQYLQLAVSIAVDMRLDRQPLHSRPVTDAIKRDVIAAIPGTRTWSSEEQRAAAGTFYLASNVSKLFNKMNVFACTEHIEAGCLALQQLGEYRTDNDLYHVVRLQRIIENTETLANAPTSDSEAQSSCYRARQELEEFRTFLVSAQDASDNLLFIQFHTAKLFLHQVIFFERQLQHDLIPHLEILREGLESAKAFLDLYLWMSPKSEMALTLSEWIQLNFGLTLAAKFAVVSRAPDVEAQTRDLRQRLNIDNVFRHLTLRIGALVGRATDGTKDRDIFAYYEQRVRKVQTWYDGMIRATSISTPPTQPSQPSSSSHSTPQIPAQRFSSTSASPLPPPNAHSMNSAEYSPQQTMCFGHSMPAGAETQPLGPIPYTADYGQIPTIAFPELINAPGWDMPFTMPMEDNSWLADLSTGYEGVGTTNPPSEGLWSGTSPSGT